MAAFFATVLLAACSDSVPGTPAASEVVYDIASDPLINPKELFELFPTDDPSSAEADPTLIRRLTNTPTMLNPIFNTLWEDHFLHGLLYVFPVTRDIDMQQMFHPDVVESWQESEDHKTFTLKLNPNLRWHDGKPWTAHDIEFTYRAILDQSVPALFYKQSAGRLASVRALDDHTVQYVHKEVLATRMRDMALPVIPRHIFDQPEQRAEDPTMRTNAYYSRYGREEIIGSGPYRFVRWAQNAEIVVERWEQSPLPKPRFKRQVLKILPDPNIALLLFKKGELHEMSLNGQQVATQTGDADFSAVGVKATGPWRMVGSVGWNCDGSNPFFGDVRVRRAMAYALDKAKFIRDAMFDLYPVSTGIFDPGHWAHNPEVEPYPYDLERAAQLLDEAGWQSSEDDGWRYKVIDGERVRFSFEFMIAQGDPRWQKLAVIYKQSLRRIGVELNVRIFEVATLVAKLKDHDFQSYLAVVEVTNDPDEWSFYWQTDAYTDGYNYVGYSNQRVDELFALGRRELDRDVRKAYYQEVQQILMDEQPFSFIWDYRLYWAFSNHLRGINLAVSGPFLHYPGLRHWWVSTQPIRTGHAPVTPAEIEQPSG